jgi:hypothetical protein
MANSRSSCASTGSNRSSSSSSSSRRRLVSVSITAAVCALLQANDCLAFGASPFATLTTPQVTHSRGYGGTRLFQSPSVDKDALLSQKPKKPDESDWIREGLIQAAYDEDDDEEEAIQRRQRPGVIGPTNVLIYDTTLRGG